MEDITQCYRVSWVIDLDATNPEAAAARALEIMRDTNSIATVFEVSLKPLVLDLNEETE